MKRPSLTLGQVFLLSLFGLAALLGLLFYRVLEDSRQSLVAGSEPLRRQAALHIGQRVEDYLHEAEQAVDHVQNLIRFGLCLSEDALSVEQHLFAEVLNNPAIAEVTLTHAVKLGHDEELNVRVAPEERWQVSAFRETPDSGSPIVTRITFRDRGRFVADVRRRPAGAGLLGAPLTRQAGTPEDPTEHLTFTTTASPRWDGTWVWSDLSQAEQDLQLPEERRRVVVTVMKTVKHADGRFVGVVRVGLRAERIDRMVREEAEANAPHRIFLSDDVGRLLTRLAPGHRLREEPDTSLRVPPEGLAPEIARALDHPALGEVRRDRLESAGRFDLDGREYLVSFKGLPKTQGWRVGIVVPADELPGIAGLIATRRRLLLSSVGVMALILAGGVATLRAVQRGLGRIVDSTARMRNFDFAPAEILSPFRDVRVVMERLELAKTAMRAMGKYVPVDLVRLLYQTGREPVLGGEMAQVSMMFTDIKEFTALSERVTPNELAAILGRYLEVMTTAIHATQGTIDKYIGDAIMAVWNVPTPCADHARRACEAALACRRATRALYDSGDWAGRAPLETRFGIHRDEVMVGHFGAPDRMSFTALGDGVNLASRLEGLNKQYGTAILVSEAVHDDARDAFAFRFLDLVAVKGKSRPVRVYELLGTAADPGPFREVARRYERAFEAYLARDFEAALGILESQPDDPPSRALAERCRRMRESPPPPDWDGVYVATSK